MTTRQADQIDGFIAWDYDSRQALAERCLPPTTSSSRLRPPTWSWSDQPWGRILWMRAGEDRVPLLGAVPGDGDNLNVTFVTQESLASWLPRRRKGLAIFLQWLTGRCSWNNGKAFHTFWYCLMSSRVEVACKYPDSTWTRVEDGSHQRSSGRLPKGWTGLLPEERPGYAKRHR